MTGSKGSDSCYFLATVQIGGPFAVSCEYENESIYWKVDTNSDKHAIVGTTAKNKASIFYIEKQSCPGVFNIANYGEQVESSARKTSSKYLIAKSRLASEGGPLQIGGKRAAYFVLRHPTKKKEELSTEYWETDACYIRVAPRKMQKRSYIAFDSVANKIAYVHSYEEEGKGVPMRFRLSRIEIEHLRLRTGSICSEYDTTLKRVRTGRIENDGEEEEEEEGEGEEDGSSEDSDQDWCWDYDDDDDSS